MAKVERPRCEFKGAPPHPAIPTYLLVWNLQSGTWVKWSCGEHRFSFGGRGYWVAKVEGFEDNGMPRTHELAALLDAPEEYRLRDDTDERLATCVDDECGNPARPGEFCDECHGAWEKKQRELAARSFTVGRPRAINRQRGF
jgi:hypothetical protein